MADAIVVHTHVTNPVTAGYLCYLAAVESWLRVADQVVVVDGGSSDGSLELLWDWVSPSDHSRLKIVASKQTHWGDHQLWAWPQIAIARQIGLSSSEADWHIHVDADHVLVDEVTPRQVKVQLKAQGDAPVVSFWVGIPNLSEPSLRVRKRDWVVQKSRTHEIVYGMDLATAAHLDYPVSLRDEIKFIDPSNRVTKRYFRGERIRSVCTLDIDVIRYGHFFFNLEQCMEKCKRIDNAVARYLGRAVSSESMLRIENSIDRRQGGTMGANHPTPVSRVIDRFWKPDMIGISLGSAGNWRRGQIIGSRMGRFLRTTLSRRLGLRGIKDLEESHLKEDLPIDVPTLYKDQDLHSPLRTTVGGGHLP